MYPIRISFGKRCPTIVITAADSSSNSSASVTDVDTKTEKTKDKKDRPKYVLTEEEKESLNKGESSLKMTGRVLVDMNKIWKGNVHFGNLGGLMK